jgi:predicted SprT family Zn-dependent metalloprotease
MLTSLTEIKALVNQLKSDGGQPALVLAVEINNRLRTSMGRAKVDRHGNKTVEFNPRLFARATVEERRQTVAHEVAHILAFVESGKMDHGPAWKRVMRRLGFDPKRCHRVDTAGIRVRQDRIAVQCPESCGWTCNMAKATHTKWRNKLSRGTHSARCPKCGARFNAAHFERGGPIAERAPAPRARGGEGRETDREFMDRIRRALRG